MRLIDLRHQFCRGWWCALATAGIALAGPGAAQTDVPGTPEEWPELLLQSGPAAAGAAAASVPIPRDAEMVFVNALEGNRLTLNGATVQAQTVAVWPESDNPRRMVLRWLNQDPAEAIAPEWGIDPDADATAGWRFDYTLVEASEGSRNWLMATRDVPLEQTEYEMHQLELMHGEHRLGLRLGMRHNDRIYWWQFVRADFIERGPVCDLMRAGGPIYNEQSTLQGDVYLVLYANGTIELFAHFINHLREGEAVDLNGVPVLAFDVPGSPPINVTLDGSHERFELGGYGLNLTYTKNMADEERPGQLRMEDGLVVLQPWLDQQVYGGLLVYDEGIPEHRILRAGGTTADLADKQALGQADRYYVATIGDRLIPKGMARTVRMILSLPGAAPDITRYQAPGWWHALAGAIPTGGYLPVKWWAGPAALKRGEGYFPQEDLAGPFEYGRRVHDGDGSLAAAMLTLGHAYGEPRFCADALPPAYWRADIPVNHADGTVPEVPFFSWQWRVQPYSRFMSVVHGYWETGDPYLLETAEIAADGYYRFFVTNRPHRSVGRDSLPVYCLFDMFRTTGDRFYLKRIRRVLKEVRASYAQTEHYWPGHQSGAGPNGIGRQPNYLYQPTLNARLHADLLEEAGGLLSEQERRESVDFMQFAVSMLEERWEGGDLDWAPYATALLYTHLTALADIAPGQAEYYGALLNKYNDLFNMPESHSGGRAYSWVSGAVRFDAWAWGATWEDGALRLRPKLAVLTTPEAPRRAVILTPEGPVTAAIGNDGGVRIMDVVSFPVEIEQ